MTTLTTRGGKGSALTHTELDNNFKRTGQTKAANYTVAATDNRDTIECSAALTITMPDVATLIAGIDTGDFQVTLKNTGSGTVTIGRTTGTDTIDGAAADLDIYANQSVTLKANVAGNGYITITGGAIYLTGSYTSTVIIAGGEESLTDTIDVTSLGTDDFDFGASITQVGGTASFLSGQDAAANFMNADGRTWSAGVHRGDDMTFNFLALPTTGFLSTIINNPAGGDTLQVRIDWWARAR